MALFTDGIISTVEELTGHDSGILEVSSAEGIDLTKKLKLAQDELAVELATLLRPGDGLGNVIVTTIVRLWHAFHTLEMVYRDAYSNQLNERYGRKRDQFAALAQWSFQKLIDAGVGLTGNPVPKADPAELAYFSGTHPAATYYVCTSWVDGLNAEGASSEWRAITVPDGNVLSVRAVNRPTSASGWNVFVGLSPEAMTQQNESVLLPEQVWLQESTITSGGRAPGCGQGVDYVRVMPRILLRG
jgi:hypothetical protein